jgi:tetratricopeptide (TPR) repeat protein
MFGLLSRRRKQRQSGALSMKDRRFDIILSRLLAYACVPDFYDFNEIINYHFSRFPLKPQDARGKPAPGAALFRAKRYDAATKALTEAVKVPDTATTAQYYLGSIARQEGRLDEAIRELQQALKANPDYTDALAELGDEERVRARGKALAARVGDQPESLRGELQSADLVRARERRARSGAGGAVRRGQKIARREGSGIPAHGRNTPLPDPVRRNVTFIQRTIVHHVSLPDASGRPLR